MVATDVDRRFILAAVLVGAAYALVAVALTYLVGAEASGAAAVGMTAVASVAFAKFESLRFVSLPSVDSVHLKIPPIHSWYLLLIFFAGLGTQWIVGTALGVFLWAAKYTGDAQTDPKVVLSLVAVSNLTLGMLAGSTAPVPRYAYALVAILYAFIFNVALDIIDFTISDRWTRIDWARSRWWLALSMVMALLGAHLALRRRRGMPNTGAGGEHAD
jgi:hypothetical protein